MRATVLFALAALLACGRDAVIASSAGSDAGAGAETGNGTPPPVADPCAGIAPPDDVPMRQYIRAGSDECRPGAADGHGTLAFTVWFNLFTSHGSSVDFVQSSGALLRIDPMGLYGDPLPQPDGFAAATGPGYLGPQDIIGLLRWDGAGNKVEGGVRWGDHLVGVADPAGGVLVAGNLSIVRGGVPEHVVAMLTGGSTPLAVKWGPKPLASTGTVYGAGVDLLGRSLVITDGTSRFGNGTISAQWFDRDGTALTGEFLLVNGFADGTYIWFETSALIGGGVLVRRMDLYGGPRALALAVASSGAPEVRQAPDWMVSRRDVQLQLARGGGAYAALPYGGSSVACVQRVEVLAPDGTSCGWRDYPLAGGTCNTRDLTLGFDGTVIQSLPLSMESEPDDHTGAHTCTWRWWPVALR